MKSGTLAITLRQVALEASEELPGSLSAIALGRYTVSTFSFQKEAPIMFLGG